MELYLHWVPAKFKTINYADNADYLGYETWGKVVAIDTCGGACPPAKQAELKLDGVYITENKTKKDLDPITTVNPEIYNVNSFVHLQVNAPAYWLTTVCRQMIPA